MREHKNNQKPRNIRFGKQHVSVPNNTNYSNSLFPKTEKSTLNHPPTKTKSKASTIIINQDNDDDKPA